MCSDRILYLIVAPTPQSCYLPSRARAFPREGPCLIHLPPPSAGYHVHVCQMAGEEKHRQFWNAYHAAPGVTRAEPLSVFPVQSSPHHPPLSPLRCLQLSTPFWLVRKTGAQKFKYLSELGLGHRHSSSTVHSILSAQSH